MPIEPSVLDKLLTAYQLVADVLGEAPQLHDCHLDQALLVLVLAMKRARRSPGLRYPRRPDYRDKEIVVDVKGQEYKVESDMAQMTMQPQAVWETIL